MTLLQYALLEALEGHNGTRDKTGRLIVSGMAFNTTTVLWCFLHGWIKALGPTGRYMITTAGKVALSKAKEAKR